MGSDVNKDVHNPGNEPEQNDQPRNPDPRQEDERENDPRRQPDSIREEQDDMQKERKRA